MELNEIKVAIEEIEKKEGELRKIHNDAYVIYNRIQLLIDTIGNSANAFEVAKDELKSGIDYLSEVV